MRVAIGGIMQETNTRCAVRATMEEFVPHDLQKLRSVGIEPSDRRVIVVKAAIAWRAAYEPIAAEIIEVDTPGITSTDLTRFSLVHLRRPIHPLDTGATYEERA